MVDQGIQRGARQGVIPPRQLLFIGLAMVALIAIMVYMSFNALPRNTEAGLSVNSSTVSSRLASAPDQVSVGGDVTVRVTWVGPEAGPVFNVAMDTHSVDLDPYDLGKMVVLHTNDRRESVPVSWDAPPGGHHRKGKLVFNELAMDGKLLVGTDTEYVELVIYDLSGVATRSFKWELK